MNLKCDLSQRAALLQNILFSSTSPSALSRTLKITLTEKTAMIFHKLGSKLRDSFERGDPKAIDAVVSRLDDIDEPISEDRDLSLLERAALFNLEETARGLVARGARPTAMALWHAAYRGHTGVVRLLIEAGVDVNVLTTADAPSLDGAVAGDSRGNLECVKLLIEAGADVNFGRGNRVMNIVMGCAVSGTLPMMQALLDAGARLNDVYLRGTALTLAAEENRPEMVAFLLSHGADTSLRVPAESMFDDIAGKTALEIAQAKRLRRVVELLEPSASDSMRSTGRIAARRADPSVADAWERIAAVLKDRKLLKKIGLQPPATARRIVSLERKLGVVFPDELRQAYLIHDGQKQTAIDLFPAPDGDEGYRWLGLSELASEARAWSDALEDEEDRLATAEDGVRPVFWNADWIPIAGNGGGDFLCVDMAPAKGGRKGQVILVSHESGRRNLAPSLGQFLADVAEALQSGGEDD